MALAAAKLAVLAEQQLRDAEAELSSNSDDDNDRYDDRYEGAKGGGGVRLDRRRSRVASPRSTSPIARSSDIHVDVDAADMDDGSDVAVDVDAGSDVAVDVATTDSAAADSFYAADDFDTITVGGPRGSSYRVSDAGGLDGAPDLGDAELEALYVRSYERALMRAEAERGGERAAAEEAVTHRAAADGARVTVRLPNAATRATRFAPGGERRGTPPRPPSS